MRDSLLRVIDDLDTRREEARKIEKDTDFKRDSVSIAQNFFASGSIAGIDYVIQELRKVLDDHADTQNKRTTANTE